jgi:hypothetical protein
MSHGPFHGPPSGDNSWINQTADKTTGKNIGYAPPNVTVNPSNFATTTTNWEMLSPRTHGEILREEIEAMKENSAEIAPNIYLEILEEEGGRAIHHLCEDLKLSNKQKAYADEDFPFVGQFFPKNYLEKNGKWVYEGYQCNRCKVRIPDDFINSVKFLVKCAKFRDGG